ncbi:MAG: SH3 domain-containing protein [Steroidobacteraceae bacterium]
MRRGSLVYSLGALLLSAFGLASAQSAFTARPMNVRAGPNGDYPLVAQLDAGAPLDVHGCLNDWSWCDVSFDDNRGWIYAGGVSFVYQGERVPLYSYGPSLGLPIITFSLSSYWGNYYRGRSWYGQRDEWAHRRMPPHMRPAGRPHAGPPPMRSGRTAAGNRPEPRGGERGRAAPNARPHAGAPPARNERPPGGARPEARGAERGHATPPARGGKPQQRERGSRPPGHPPLSS